MVKEILDLSANTEALDKDLCLITEAAREAGLIARRFFEGGFESWKKTDDTPVTEADIAVDTFLREALVKERPYGWVSEESALAPDRLSHNTLFVVDPIDGTEAFARKRTDWVIAIGVVHEGRPVAGVVYNVMEKRLFSARLGGGARLNGKPIRTTQRSSLDNLRLASENHDLARAIANAGYERPSVARCLAFAYRLCLIAAGEADVSLTLRKKMDWDVAGAEIILTEAGGKVSDRAGMPLTYNTQDVLHPNVMAAGDFVHAALQSLLEKPN